MTDVKKVKVSVSTGQQELDNAQKQFDAFDQNIKDLTQDRMNAAPKEDREQQTKIAQSDLDKMKDLYLKPKRSIPSREKFNEEYRKEYEFAKEFVNFIAENHEIIGESIDLWTKPFAGMPAEEWIIPTNKPLWAPRYVAERIKGCTYHRLKMENKTMGIDGGGEYYGSMAVDTTVQRLDAIPATTRKSIFMGARSF